MSSSSHADEAIVALLLATPCVTASGVELLGAVAAGCPLVAWSLDALRAAPEIGEIVLVVESTQEDEARALVAALGDARVRVVGVEGAAEGEAIRAGVKALASSSAQMVVVHEVARPLVTAAMLAAGIAAFRGAAGIAVACASAPVKETIKRVREGVVVETLDRSRLALLQTPFVFDREELAAVCGEGGGARGLAAMLAELRAVGRSVVLYAGGAEHLAVVTVDDLALADRLLRARVG